jgi:hypothetical protein
MRNPERQIEIARAIASGETRLSIVRRFAKLWGVTERTIRYMIDQILEAKKPRDSAKPVDAQKLMAETISQIRTDPDDAQRALLENARAVGNYRVVAKVFLEMATNAKQ